MVAFQLSEADGEMLLIGLLAMIAAMIFYKLDQMMQVQSRTNDLLAKLVPGDKPSGPERPA